ncbi:Signal recognition particle receptor subunit beta [Ceratocystis lukuohia]|uniref:Signal recognition particle receptor subunit beta n=3 Tax=Ceratocystis TaxID=5157 RepID=A0A0F8BYP1_CERFI|nr:Signal recognition particle receptor subunit beta [Ceratocystis platani]PHH56243.1 hypothetical protein CFIMG_007182RA00001 [Ceratocystis fimbriata CBS 114723]
MEALQHIQEGIEALKEYSREAITWSLTPSYELFVVASFIVILIPLVLHYIVVKATPYTTLPSIVLAGPCNAGKTALLTLFENNKAAAETHTSLLSTSVEFTASTKASARDDHLQKNDVSGQHTKFLIVDTPGHPKLRAIAGDQMTSLNPKKAADADSVVKGIVFMVDASALSEPEILGPTAEYLYEILMLLQRRAASSKSSRPPPAVPVLIAANKMDLFTASPAAMVKAQLEMELSRIRSSRSKGLLDSGADSMDVNADDQDSWLGAYGTSNEKFTFSQMLEFDIDIDVIGGNVVGDGPGVNKWWSWMVERI